jgi:LmbE family N-acetylglucosaminyl deacetylase
VLSALAQLPYATSKEPRTTRDEIAINRGSVALWQSLKKLHTCASLMMITAHPDDEDGGTLTYESRGRGSRVSLLTLNRGEGGANVMFSDYFDALGLIRTQELLAADEYYGVDQYWTRLVDYGFSKTKAESLRMWTHDRVLYDVVRIVRTVRPMVITSVFVGEASDGHGNHQTAGAMAQEVFKAAGDPNVFPDQIKAGLRPWTPLKDYARVPLYVTGQGAKLQANVEVPEGTYDAVLGLSYWQVSREGLGHQKTQNGGSSTPSAGQMLSSYHRFGSIVSAADKENSFFDGIDTTVQGIAGLASSGDTGFLKAGLSRINSAVEEATAKYSASRPEATAPALAAGFKETLALIEQVKQSNLPGSSKYDVEHELEIKRAQFNDALGEALGLSLSALVAPSTEPNPLIVLFMGDPDTFRIAVPGQSFDVKSRVVNRSSAAVTLERLNLQGSDRKEAWKIERRSAMKAATLVSDLPVETRFTVTVPANASFTRPYFSRPNIEQSYYDIGDERLLGLPQTPYPLAAWAELSYEGVPIRIGQLVQTVRHVNGEGGVYEPLVVGPPIGVSISPRAGIVPLEAKSLPVAVHLHSNVKGVAEGRVRLQLPDGWTSDQLSKEFAIAGDGQDQSLTFEVEPSRLRDKPYEIRAVCEFRGHEYREGYREAGYAGLLPSFLYSAAISRLSGVNVKVAPDLKVGYVMGTGDDVPASLQQLSVPVTLLSPTDIAEGDLSRFDVILLGVRTYAAREDLRVHNARILEYVREGGVLIVQYNTPEFDENYGPFPYVMGADPEEVTDETSKVNILEPANPMFTWPNRISEQDFAGWVEERGSKWMKSWDPRYHALLETHDEDQAPQKGGLLYARYGKGIYIYNAYAFYRELPEGVPGAYRIFGNMISLAKNPQR